MSKEADGVQKKIQRRRRYTVKEKLPIVHEIRKKVAAGSSIAKAAKDYSIHRKLYTEWKQNLDKLKEVRVINSRAKSVCKGRPSFLENYKEDLLKVIFELRGKGTDVSISMVIIKATTLSREFHEKPKKAQYHQVSRWCKTQKLVLRIATHESQKDPRETSANLLNLVAMKIS